jgi:hypothetical protein
MMRDAQRQMSSRKAALSNADNWLEVKIGWKFWGLIWLKAVSPSLG